MGKFFSAVFASLTSAGRAVLSFILPILKSKAGSALADILPIAEGVVLNLVSSKLSGDAKRTEATSQLQELLVNEGRVAAKDITSSLLNLAIEMAVSRLKVSIA